MAQRLYRADAVTAPPRVPGILRPYTAADEEIAVRWLGAFAAEALGGEAVEDAREFLKRRLDDPDAGLALWEDDRPVSLAGFAGPTPSGIRVAPVYTPPELRRRGYATALVAELTQMLLAGGRRFCFLFTDRTNPTSNSIYQQVGYEPVADVDLWRFG
jgi:predicted GNAT family acetyltransferase